MKKYLAFFKIRFSMGLQYRVAAIAGAFTQFFWGSMLIMTYKAFYEADAAAFPMTFSATVSYIWLQQAFLGFFGVWMERELLNTILSGDIAYELCRPIKIYDMWFVKNAADRVSKTFLRCLPILCVTAFLPAPYRLGAPASALHLLLFFFTLVMGLLVMVASGVLVCGLNFFTISPQGVWMIYLSIVEFCSGAVIPLPFFPEKVQKILELLPFASMQNVALRIYSGSMSEPEMTRAVLLQLLWLFTLAGAGKLLCHFAEKKVIIQGG